MAVLPRRTRPERKIFCHHQRLRFLLAIFLSLSLTVWTAHGSNFDPFQVLGVSRTASPDEIKKCYRKQCLKYHPDKNVDKSEEEQKIVLKKFKMVQEAYDMIENNKFDRRSFGSNANRQSNQFGRSFNRQSNQFGSDPRSGTRSSSSSTQQNPFGNDIFNDFFDVAFSINRENFARRTGREQPTTPPNFTEIFQGAMEFTNFKSIYVQSVKIPLKDLYKGKPSFQFELHDNPLKKYRASIRGKAFFCSLGMAIIYLIISMPASSGPNKYFNYFASLVMIHATTPTPNPSASYIKPIQKGSKGGETTVRFSPANELEIIFKIQEAPHPVYRRKGDNLHAELVITRKEAEKGCKKTLKALDPSEEAIEITIPPKKYKYMNWREYRVHRAKNLVTIRGRGWPLPKNKDSETKQETDDYDYGDLKVHIRVKK